MLFIYTKCGLVDTMIMLNLANCLLHINQKLSYFYFLQKKRTTFVVRSLMELQLKKVVTVFGRSKGHLGCFAHKESSLICPAAIRFLDQTWPQDVGQALPI